MSLWKRLRRVHRERRALRKARRAKTFHVKVRAKGLLFCKKFATKKKAEKYVDRQRCQGHVAWFEWRG